MGAGITMFIEARIEGVWRPVDLKGDILVPKGEFLKPPIGMLRNTWTFGILGWACSDFEELPFVKHPEDASPEVQQYIKDWEEDRYLRSVTREDLAKFDWDTKQRFEGFVSKLQERAYLIDWKSPPNRWSIEASEYYSQRMSWERPVKDALDTEFLEIMLKMGLIPHKEVRLVYCFC